MTTDQTYEVPSDELESSPDPVEERLQELLSTHAWVCSCGESFDDPNKLHSHWMRRKRDEGEGHDRVGLANQQTGELFCKYGPHLYAESTDWKDYLRKRIRRDLPSDAGGEPEELEDDFEPGEPQVYRARVQYRPRVYDIDESLVTMYHLFINSMHKRGLNYQEPFGDWVRNTVFRFYMEHSELIDLSSMLTPEEKQFILEGVA